MVAVSRGRFRDVSCSSEGWDIACSSGVIHVCLPLLGRLRYSSRETYMNHPLIPCEILSTTPFPCTPLVALNPPPQARWAYPAQGEYLSLPSPGWGTPTGPRCQSNDPDNPGHNANSNDPIVTRQGNLLGFRVSRLTTGRPRNLRHDMQLPRHLVTGHMLARYLLDALQAHTAIARTAITAVTLLPKRSSGVSTTRQSNTCGCALTLLPPLPERFFHRRN